MSDITVTSQVSVPNGPKISFSRTLSVEAFDKLDIPLPANTTDREVSLQPGGAGQVKLMLVVADWYGDKLSYKVNAAAGTARLLDQPHLLTGEGAVSLLGAAPTSLFFTNATTGPTAQDATIQILVGRDATP